MQIVTAPPLAAPTVTRSKAPDGFGQDFDAIVRSLDGAGTDQKSPTQGEDPAAQAADFEPDLAEDYSMGLALAEIQVAQAKPDVHISAMPMDVTAPDGTEGQMAEQPAKPNPPPSLPVAHAPVFAATAPTDPSNVAKVPSGGSPLGPALAETAAGPLPRASDVVADIANTPPPPTGATDLRLLPAKGREAKPSSQDTPLASADASQPSESADAEPQAAPDSPPRLAPAQTSPALAAEGGRLVAPQAPDPTVPITLTASGSDPSLAAEVPNFFREIAAQPSSGTPNGQIVRPDGSFAAPTQQIAQAVVRMGANGPVELALNPAELGQVRFEMTTTGDKLHITLFVERPEAMDLIRRNGEHLLIDLRLSGFNNPSLSFGDWSQRDARNPQSSNPPKGAEPEGPSAHIGIALALAQHAAASGRLDMRL